MRMEWEIDYLVVRWLYRPFSSLGGVARVGGGVEPSPFPLSAEEHMGCSPLLHFSLYGFLGLQVDLLSLSLVQTGLNCFLSSFGPGAASVVHCLH